jgi:uncharacterized protein (TIGR02246 family)
MQTTFQRDSVQCADLPQAFAAAWNRHDMDSFADLFSADAEMVNVVGIHWRGREAIRAAHAGLHAGPFRDSTLEIEAVSEHPLSADFCAVHARWRLAGQRRPDGTPDGERRGILLLVARKAEAGWAIEVAQNTDIVPGVAVPSAPSASK